jgi:hypothetical protein
VSQIYQKPAGSDTLTCFEGVKSSFGQNSVVSKQCSFEGGYCLVGKLLKESENMIFFY